MHTTISSLLTTGQPAQIEYQQEPASSSPHSQRTGEAINTHHYYAYIKKGERDRRAVGVPDETDSDSVGPLTSSTPTNTNS